EDGIRDWSVTGVQTCALPISREQRAQFPLMRRCVALKDDGDRCGKEFDVTHPNTRAVTCSEKCRRARLREIEHIRYHADIAASRSEERRVGKEGRDRERGRRE